MDTIEQKIADRFVERLQALPSIVTACDGRTTPFNPTELPAANLFTPTSETSPAGPMDMDHELQLSIVLHVADKTAQRVIRSLVAEVYAMIGEAERDPAGFLGIPEIITSNDPAKAVKCTQQGDFIGSAQIALNITYRTARWAM